MAQSNFQDVVVLNQNTLSVQGEQIVLGGDVGSKSLVFANSSFSQAVAANPSANETIMLPNAGGTVGLITAITAGTTLASNGLVVFSNSNNVSFGMSGNTITATVSGGAAVTGGVSALGVSTVGQTAGSTGTTIGTIVFAAIGNITLSQVTAAGSLATISFIASQSTVPAAFAAGTQTATSGTVVFSNSNGISFGMSNSSVITASADAVRSISAGTTNATGNQIVFSNSNGISFGANGATITAQLPSVKYWDDRHDFVQSIAYGNHSSVSLNLLLQRISLPFQLSATELDFVGSLVDGGSGVATHTFSAGIYTFSGSTASSVSSASISFSYAAGSTTTGAFYGAESGVRWRSIGLGTWNVTPGEYLLGFLISNTNSALSWILFGGSSLSLNAAPGGGNYSAYFADGIFSTGTNAFPASIHLSAVVQTGSQAQGQPYIRLIGSG